MSIRLPDTNASPAVAFFRLALPTGAANKPANTGFTTVLFTEYRGSLQNNARNMLTRNTGAASGNDCTLGLATDNLLLATLRDASVVLATNIGQLTVNFPLLVPGKTYCIMVICNTSATWLVVCEPGGVPFVLALTLGATNPFQSGFAGGGLTGVWNAIGGAAGGNPYHGPVEEFSFYHGLFPESAGLPDATLIANIANGTQDPATLARRLTGGSLRFRYRMPDETDLADISAFARGNLATVSENRAAGQTDYTSGPLRPAPLMPDKSIDAISQVIFATPGDAASATINRDLVRAFVDLNFGKQEA